MKVITKSKAKTKIRKEVKEKSYVYKIIHSPVGDLKLVASTDGLAAILWYNDKHKHSPQRLGLHAANENKKNKVLVQTEKQLAEYFAGKRKKFVLKTDFAGTEFQKKVWNALLGIPYGETVSYGDIARQIGKPKAMRAVGAANGKNPITIVAACHRVIGSSGQLTGYAGGMNKKVSLLQLEGRKMSGKLHAHTRVMKKK